MMTNDKEYISTLLHNTSDSELFKRLLRVLGKMKAGDTCAFDEALWDRLVAMSATAAPKVERVDGKVTASYTTIYHLARWCYDTRMRTAKNIVALPTQFATLFEQEKAK